MAIHFSEAELKGRRERACRAMAADGLDGLLIFRQESMFYLTGYDTFGFVYFQCLYLGADGDMFLLTRAPDLRQARHTSVIEEIHVWVDREGVNPARELRDLLHQRRLSGKKLGVEWESYGLTAANGRRLDHALDGFCDLEDASTLVSRLRLVKSAAELDYVRRAAELADEAYDRALDLAGPGADEGAILAAMQGAVFEGGGDYAGNEFIIGSGPDALLCRYKSGRRRLDARDQLTLEWAGVYRHYHAAMMNTFLIGAVSDAHRALHAAAREAILECEAALKPGNSMSDVFMAHARVLDAHGLKDHRMNACGYAMGTCFAPNWMDWPMFYEGNPVELKPGMTFFIHIIIANSDDGLAMTLGRSSIVGESGAEVLSKRPLDLVVR
ncbi:aminopeptidase P family protein [Marivibrio halodurans]|uniref:Aminopeptidase P family protein n=1 Tax=Marivibrio halodurans TaxID=2039722 RepID=A0A8J7S4C2_9PROT|nr:Xaa-Pro peptidase family protein [Marivibrio halodurans]MBP5858524.1 aminopeptidase P family protein [Marivibrio halodurans]